MKHPPRAESIRTEGKAEPFARAQRLADDTIARAESAENLKRSIEALRGTLTAEQLNKVTELNTSWEIKKESLAP
jgi:hypothetical protein